MHIYGLFIGMASKIILSETPLASLVGHPMRISRAVFHPSGRYIGTSSFDTTWRLWDAETQKELLLQEGHSRQLYGLAFQSDGSLVATGYLKLYFENLVEWIVFPVFGILEVESQ